MMLIIIDVLTVIIMIVIIVKRSFIFRRSESLAFDQRTNETKSAADSRDGFADVQIAWHGKCQRR